MIPAMRLPVILVLSIGCLLGCGVPLPAPPAPRVSRPADATHSPPVPTAIPKPATDIAPETFSKLVELELGEMPPTWSSVEMDEVSVRQHGRVSLAIYYKEQPSGYEVVEQDTTRLVRAMLAALVKKGVDPLEMDITVAGRGRQRITGETGTELVRVYGRSMWLSVTDSIGFTKDK